MTAQAVLQPVEPDVVGDILEVEGLGTLVEVVSDIEGSLVGVVSDIEGTPVDLDSTLRVLVDTQRQEALVRFGMALDSDQDS